MRTPIRTLTALAVTTLVATSGSVWARQAPAQSPAAKPVVPVRVEVTISRFAGDKKIGSLPYLLVVNANAQRTSMRMGVDVPIGTAVTTSERGVTTTQPSYRNVGTGIDCGVETTDDGRFRVYVQVSDSSIFTADADSRSALKSADPAAFRQFSTSNYLTLRDGQVMQFTAATDKITGETIKVDVLLSVIK